MIDSEANLVGEMPSFNFKMSLVFHLLQEGLPKKLIDKNLFKMILKWLKAN